MEIDPDGTKCTYKWYKGDGTFLTSAKTKEVTIAISNLLDIDVYFIAE
jgi:hypothetical protein